MPTLIDTDVAIHWRDGDPSVIARIAGLPGRPHLSVVSNVELENGVHRDPADAAARRLQLDAMLQGVILLDFTRAEMAAYAAILVSAGPAKRKTNDRMIAATALVHGLTLITMNGDDFRDVPGLELEVWESPGSRGG